jgi:hypothetical protein
VSPRRQATRIKLRPADPFDLIRWLARSQSDLRNAVAELAQNSLDASARTVSIERRRVRGAPSLVVRDDGEGVIPEMDRGRAALPRRAHRPLTQDEAVPDRAA